MSDSSAEQQQQQQQAAQQQGGEKKQEKRQKKEKGGKKAEAAEGGASAAPAAAAASSSAQIEGHFDMDKAADFPAWYDSILRMADVMDKRYPVKGMPIFSPYGFFMHNEIMNILEVKWAEQGIDKVQFPILIPYEFLAKEADHIAGFSKEVFWVTKGGDKDLESPSALRPTSETAMYSIFSLWVQSFRDLPVKVHQTCAVYRFETKDTLPLIRAREIYWNEAHTCHTTKQEALDNLEAAWDAYMYVIRDCLCVDGLRLRRPIWDQFAGAEHTDVLDVILPSGKVLQSVGAHYLGQKFAKPFDIKFLTAENTYEYAYMTCYGVSTRLLASCIAAHGDNKGLVLPSKIAKIQVVIVPIVMKNKKEMVIEAAKKIHDEIKAAGIRVFLDDADKKPGEKYNFWEMKGVPLRLEVGPRDIEQSKVMLVRRADREKFEVSNADLIPRVRELLEEQDNLLRRNALQFMNDRVNTCSSIEEIAVAVRDKGGFARIPLFSDGRATPELSAELQKLEEEIIKPACGGEIRGFMAHEAAPEGINCLLTGRPATCWGYVARSY